MTVTPTRRHQTDPTHGDPAQAGSAGHHWPDLQLVPSGPRSRVESRIARRLFRAAVSRLDVTVQLSTGPDSEPETWGRGGPVAVVHRPEEFFARLGRDQLIGFGEAYMTGAWGTPDPTDLGDFLSVLATEMADLVPRSLQRLRSVVVARPPRTQRSSRRYSRTNIAHHYDLSNDLFRIFLDRTMSYSAALFDGLPARATRAQLEDAQVRKIERLLDQAHVGPGSRVLEIGTGWGELALRAARRGATVRSITLSSEQQALARDRIEAAGLSDRVTVDLCDYRAVTGSYDAVLSIEMIEAVGWQYWQTYFETIDRVLVPGGRVGLQAITMPHDRMLVTRRTYTWINKYIFPGGFLPSVQAIDEVTRAHTGLRLVDRLSIGDHYAATLRMWDEEFLAHREEVLGLGFDEVFIRMWHFYLEYSRAGFASGYLDDFQLTLAKEEPA